MATSKVIPEEIIFDILSRLPAKCIGQFRCVSKQWRTLLSDPHFIKTHLSVQQEDKLIIACDYSLYTICFARNPEKNGYDIITTKLDFLEAKLVTVEGSCNGLVLVVDFDETKFLINPTTLKYHKVPDSHFPRPISGSMIMHGLGYDIRSDDYKVVTISCIFYAPYQSHNFVDVYSVRKGGPWRRLEAPYYQNFPFSASGVFVNGALHWLACKTTYEFCEIAAFDLSDERFLEVPAPDTCDKLSHEFTLVALRGYLCVTTCTIISNDFTIIIWMMKDYGVKESWTLFKIKDSFAGIHCVPSCSVSDDDFVFCVHGKMVIYHMKQKEHKVTTGNLPPFLDGAQAFGDSLVSPPCCE